MAQRFAPAESNLALLAAVQTNVATAIEHYLPEAARPGYRRAWLDSAWSALHAADPGSGAQLAWARTVAAAGFSTPPRTHGSPMALFPTTPPISEEGVSTTLMTLR